MPKPVRINFDISRAEYDLRANSASLSNNALVVMNNTYYDRPTQAIVCRGGMFRYTTPQMLSSTNYGAGLTWNPGFPNGQQVAVKDGTLYKWTDTVPSVTVTTVGSGMSSSVQPSLAAFRDGSTDVVYIADGGLLNKYDNTTLTQNIASTPAVSTVTVYNQRLFGITGTDQTLYWSGLNNGDTLGIAPNGGSAVIRTFKNDPIVGLVPVGQSLFVIHTNSVSRFTGWSQDDFNVSDGQRGVTPLVGAQRAPRCLVEANRQVYVFGTDGLFTISEGGEITRISDPVWLDNIVTGEPVAPSLALLAAATSGSAHGAVAVPSREEVWFQYQNDFWLWNYGLGRWTGHYTFGPSGAGKPISLWLDRNATVANTNTALLHVLTSDGWGLFHVPQTGQQALSVATQLTDDAGTAIPYEIRFASPEFSGDHTEPVALRNIHLNVGQLGVAGTGAMVRVVAQGVTTNSPVLTFPGGDTRFRPNWFRVAAGGMASDITIGLVSTGDGGNTALWHLYDLQMTGFVYPARPAASGAAYS